MKTCIISCVFPKVWDKDPNMGPTPAKDVYLGYYFRTLREYADLFFINNWFIISAFYGIIHKDFMIPKSYNVTFNNKNTNPISMEDLQKTVYNNNLLNYDTIEVLGGEQYKQIISEIIPKEKLLFPFDSLTMFNAGMGYQAQYLRKQMSDYYLYLHKKGIAPPKALEGLEKYL